MLIRGADSTTPIVLFLHGGPGMPAMYLAHAFQRPLEQDSLMVQWERRGAGKSYGARHPAESLTVSRTLADLYELTQWLREHFHRERTFFEEPERFRRELIRVDSLVSRHASPRSRAEAVP